MKAKATVVALATVLLSMTATAVNAVGNHEGISERDNSPWSLGTRVVVNVEAKKLTVWKGFLPVFTCEVKTSRFGIGHTIRSRKTPTGEFTVTKEGKHRYGKVLRLSGYQGYNRGILLHKDYGNPLGTNGCICPKEPHMKKLYDLIPDHGARLIVHE